MTLLICFLIFIAVAVLLSLAGLRLYVRPQEAIERVAGAAVDGKVSMPVHPSLVFHDLVKRLGNLVPASPKDVSVTQRRLIRAGYRNPQALKVLFGD
jgi:tight adherence protein C